MADDKNDSKNFRMTGVENKGENCGSLTSDRNDSNDVKKGKIICDTGTKTPVVSALVDNRAKKVTVNLSEIPIVSALDTTKNSRHVRKSGKFPGNNEAGTIHYWQSKPGSQHHHHHDQINNITITSTHNSNNSSSVIGYSSASCNNSFICKKNFKNSNYYCYPQAKKIFPSQKFKSRVFRREEDDNGSRCSTPSSTTSTLSNGTNDISDLDERDMMPNCVIVAEGGEGLPLMQCGLLEVAPERRQRVAMMDSLGVKSGSEGGQRLAVLSCEQVRRLNDVMEEKVSIYGRGNFPTLEVKLRDLVTIVRTKLESDQSSGGAGMKVRDIRLNGGAASHVLATESQPYNDLDLIFAVELSSGRNFDRVKSAVVSSLFDLLPEGVNPKKITTCSLKEAYVSKMVKVNHDGDRWSLISLGNSRGHKNVELKFVDTMRRQFEFSVDSFQIVLDSLLLFYECSKLPIGENFYPTVVGESVYGDFQEALYHLQQKLISTRHPEEIRGGGLLKYCTLLVKNYRPARPDHIKMLERYMCSRFFIDFPDINQQQSKLENYLWNHFVGPEEEALMYQFLMLLHNVVEESTVCLMGHERRQTLALIEELACRVLCEEQQKLLTQNRPQFLYANGYYYAPVIATSVQPCYPVPCTCPAGWMATCSS